MTHDEALELFHAWETRERNESRLVRLMRRLWRLNGTVRRTLAKSSDRSPANSCSHFRGLTRNASDPPPVWHVVGRVFLNLGGNHDRQRT